DKHTLDTLQAWRARGRSVAVVVIETADLLGEPASPAEALARRVLRLDLDLRRRELAELGIPVVTATADDPMTNRAPALRRARHPVRHRAGRRPGDPRLPCTATRPPGASRQRATTVTQPRVVLASCSVALVALVVVTGALLGPDGARTWLLVCGAAAVFAAAQ